MTRPTVAFTWHWQYADYPEGTSALPHYREAVESLAADPERPYDLLGHAHPRAWAEVDPWYRAIGIEAVASDAEVFARADVLVADTSSLLYEFASLDRPVVVLNAPWYRRDVDHGGRFWEHADVGIQVDEPDDLADAIARSLTDPPAVAQRRREIVAAVYSRVDGTASARAVDAIHSVIGQSMARRVTTADTDPYAAKAVATISGFSPRLEVHPPIPRLAWLGAPPHLVSHIRQEWAGLSEAERLTSVEMFENLTDDEVRTKIAESLAELEADGVTAGDPDTVVIEVGGTAEPLVVESVPDGTASEILAWVGDGPVRARDALATEAGGQRRKVLMRNLRKIAARG